jgi:hypothetical protein
MVRNAATRTGQQKQKLEYHSGREEAAARNTRLTVVWAAAVWTVSLVVMGVADALQALYRHLKLLLLTLSPSHEFELESDKAGRAAELRVSSLYVSILLSFFPCAISSISQFFFKSPSLLSFPPWGESSSFCLL